MLAVVWNTKEQVEGRNRVQMNIGLQVIAAANGDRGSIVGFGRIAVVGDGISSIKRPVDGSGEILGFGLMRRDGMQGIPRRRGGRDEVGAGVERGELVCALIVGGIGVNSADTTDACAAIFTVKRNHGMTN